MCGEDSTVGDDPIKARKEAISRILHIAKTKGAHGEAEMTAIKTALDKSRHTMKARLESTRDDIWKSVNRSGNKKLPQLIADITTQVVGSEFICVTLTISFYRYKFTFVCLTTFPTHIKCEPFVRTYFLARCDGTFFNMNYSPCWRTTLRMGYICSCA